MTIANVITQLITQVQFLGLFGSLDVPMPDAIGSAMEYINIANLDIRLLIGQQKIPTITFRRIFMGVSLVIPLLITLALALLFQPIYVVLWYSALLLGVILLAAGMLGQFLPQAGVDTASPMTFIIIGALVLGTALFVAAVFTCATHIMDGNATEGDRVARTWRYYEAFHRRRSLGHMLLFVFFLVTGLLFMRATKVTFPGTGTQIWFDSQVWTILGIVLCSLSFLCFIYAMANMLRCGRRHVIRLTMFVSNHLLLLIVVAISASYSPVIDYASNVFLCTNYDCPNATVFNPYAERPLNSFDTSAERFCDRCNFNLTEQPHCAAFSCSGIKSLRSWKYPESPCDDEAAYYFYIAAVAAFVCYAFAIPILYFLVVRMNAEGVTAAQVAPGDDEEADDDLWVRKMSAVDPVASSLYDSFKYPRKNFQILVLLYRLVVTLVVNILAALTSYAIGVVLVIHALALVFTSLYLPFINRFEQALAIVLAFCNTFDGAFAVYLWRSDNKSVSTPVVVIVIIINVALPLGVGAAAAFMEFYSRRVNKIKAEEKEKEFDDALDAANQAGVDPEEHFQARAQHLPHNAPLNGADTGVTFGELPTGTTPPSATPRARRNHRRSYFDRRTSAALAVTVVEKKTRLKNNRVLVTTLNDWSESRLSRTFMVLGIIFMLALGLCILGTQREKKLEYLVGSDALYRTVDTTLAGYQTWSEFTSNCCCLTQETPNLDFNTTERWTCANGRTVEHGRVSSDFKDNGLFLRGLCKTTHRTGCDMVSKSDVASLVCVDASSIVGTNVTSTAYALLW